MSLQQRIENIGKDLDYETGFFYDAKTGKILWEQKDGKYDIIDILPYVTKHNVSDAVWVHNHPPEFIGTYIAWSPLSPADIYNAAYYNQAGIIANDGCNIYSMFRPKNGWGTVAKMSTKEFDKLWWKESERLDKIDQEKVKNLKMSVENYYHEALFNRTNKMYKNLFGLSMTMTPLKHPHIQNVIGVDFIPPQHIPDWMKTSPKLMTKLKKEFEYALEQVPALKEYYEKSSMKGRRTSAPRRSSTRRAPAIRVNFRKMI